MPTVSEWNSGHWSCYCNCIRYLSPLLTVGSNVEAGAAGIVTAKGADINGDIDVDGHSNLDNVSIAGNKCCKFNIR